MDRLLGGKVESLSLDNCLGLVPKGSLSKLPRPKNAGVKIETDASKTCLQELAHLFAKHGETEIEIKREGASERRLLASAGWAFPEPNRDADPLEDAKKRLPLADVWLEWLAQRSDDSRDKDGLELVRAWACSANGNSYLRYLPPPFRKHNAWDLVLGFERLVKWMSALSGAIGGGAFLVQYAEDALARPIRSAVQTIRGFGFDRSQENARIMLAEFYLRLRPSDAPVVCRQHLAMLSMQRADAAQQA